MLKPSRRRRIWAWPVALGALTASGLAAALLADPSVELSGDPWVHAWSWFALGVPVAVMAWFAWRRG
ncbi:MAG: hypothetical protein LCI02_09875 [Proteobacteria bacterium]|nr:hypothetical protein [Pseudomonadota bacterium]